MGKNVQQSVANRMRNTQNAKTVNIGTLPEVEVKNDSGSPIPVNGTVTLGAGSSTIGTMNIGTVPATGNALPVNTRNSMTLTNRSGTITTGGTAQNPVSANTGRKYLIIQNVSTGDLWVGIGVTAVQNQPSIKISPSEKFIFSEYVPTVLISIIGATTGQAFTIWEG